MWTGGCGTGSCKVFIEEKLAAEKKVAEKVTTKKSSPEGFKKKHSKSFAPKRTGIKYN